MLGTFLWNSGALGSIAAWNIVTWVPDQGSLASSKVGASAAVGIGTHTAEILPGNRIGAFVDDFYYRFHITTLVLDLGNLVSDQTQQVTLWNAYRRAWILNSLTLLNAEGIEITGQPDPPLQFNPLQERAYTIGITTDGPAQIDATISWTFSNGHVVQLSVIGQRVIPWNWGPDWNQGMIERVQWFTDVIPAARGEEQRRSIRIEPRQFLEFTSEVQGTNRKIMEAALWGWGARIWAVPIWPDGLELAGTLASGSTVIPVNPAMRTFVVGELVLITNGDPATYEAIEVAALSSSITLSRPTQQTWGAGARVYPARVAVMENLATVSRFTGQAGGIRLQWRMLDPLTWAAAATPTYRGLPVFEQKPNWIEDPTLAFERKVSVLDANSGLTEIEDEADMPLTTQRMRFTLTSRTELDTWKKRLWALRGKQGSIWVPSWADDLTVVAVIGDLALSIDVESIGYTKYLQMDPGRRDLRIELRNGTVLYRRITGTVEVSATVERLSIDASLGVTVNPADVMLVCFLGLTRSDSDNHEIAYFTGDIADTVFSARGFRHEL